MSSQPGLEDEGAGDAWRPQEPPDQELQRAGSRSGGGTARSICSSSSTWSPFMKNLLLGLSRKMRLSQKIAYQVYQAMNTPGNFWLMHQLKDFGCHWGKKSELCSAHEDFMYDIIQDNKQYEKDVRIQQLKQLLEDSTSDEDGSSSSSSEGKEKHKKKKRKEKRKKRKKEKKKKKKRKHTSSKSNESSESE
ncbi:LOW QUALITY PROTEIN: retinitis pigmentosa 9 protein [Rhinopithecus roxellana]|uniref:LOW QUALITY PROTEIN: retinitis pigmentosa 9 protein n=1 Tax=Rhinopithecus roxellana TaxID=61622 RepID=UPI001237770F|nr:LOW QUALITY PROTEIN: retinitis pigmentosa 9 protein [Rhinopithecus roxellana]